jgi:hypothetical protein
MLMFLKATRMVRSFGAVLLMTERAVLLVPLPLGQHQKGEDKSFHLVNATH